MSNSQEIIPVSARNEAALADGLARQFASITIKDQDQYETAAIDLKGISLKSRELDELRKTLTKPLDESKKRIMDFFRKPLEALEAAAGHIKAAMLTYQRQQEAIRIAEENRLRELQRQQEEKLRQEAEAKRLEEERLCKLAEAELAKGNQAKAEALIAKAETVSAAADAAEQTVGVLVQAVPTVESSVRKIAGIATREVWSFRVVDATKIPREYLIVDEVKLGQIARATKGLIKIDGVEFFSNKIVAA